MVQVDCREEKSYHSGMAVTLDQIVEEARHLPSDVVAELVDRILETQHAGSEQDTDTAWRAEVRKRIDDIQSGKVAGIPVNDTLARARKTAGL